MLPTTYSVTKERRKLPCTHPLRIRVPSLFTHCNSIPCKYGKWSSWVKTPNSVVSVPVSQCPSAKAYKEERTRTSVGRGCTEPLRETQSICLPSQEDLLILTLGLGGSGNNYKAFNQPINTGLFQVSSLNLLPAGDRPDSKCPQFGTNGRICRNIPGVGKRSTEKDIKLPASKLKESVISNQLQPLPFNWVEHGPRLRQRRQSLCDDNDIQHVLFVLDTSGSIGSAQFERMKEAIGLLPVLFCRQVKFALITFSTYVNLEFCFDCFENTFDGRGKVSEAINNAKFQGDGTNTAGTARCICEEVLRGSCGITADAECLDVVFITDGKSNDPKLEICDEIRCLHRRFGVNTYAIGINSGAGFTPSYNRTELECISNFSDLTSVFEFDSFESFEASLIDIFDRLLAALPQDPESCARRDSSISPSGAPPFFR